MRIREWSYPIYKDISEIYSFSDKVSKCFQFDVFYQLSIFVLQFEEFKRGPSLIKSFMQNAATYLKD